ncbi:MAG: polysaccharide biosynthesis protein [Clostridia bacterium]
MKSRKLGEFYRGVLLLSVLGVIAKFIGAIYRIPLTSLLGAEGIGIYQLVFPLYSLLLTISSSGLPASISKLVSASLAVKDYKRTAKIMRASFILLFIFSLICSLIVVSFSSVFASFQGNSNATLSYIAIAPAIFFVGLISGFRGYAQAHENMRPTAISGLIEQIVKMVAGLLFSYLLLDKGVAYASMGAVIGVSLSEVIALFYLFINYIIFKKKHSNENVRIIGFNFLKESKNVLNVSFPITLGFLILPLTQFIDSSVIINLLKFQGFSTTASTELFGLSSGTVGSLINMPVAISLGIAMAVLPRVCRFFTNKDIAGTEKSASDAICVVVSIALPCSILMMIFSPEIIKLLYSNSLSNINLIVASDILSVASMSIFYLSIVQVTTGILQGIGKIKVPLISLAIGGTIKVVLTILLVSIGQVNIFGAEIATAFCYFIAGAINIVIMKKHLNLNIMKSIWFAICVSITIFFISIIIKTINISAIFSLLIIGFASIIIYVIMYLIFFKRKKHLNTINLK